MLNDRMAAANDLKTRIRAAKAAANTSLVETGNLIAALGAASLRTGLYAEGQAAVQKALEMAHAAASFRALAGETHKELANARVAAGLAPFAGGDTQDCPEPDFVGATLRSVA